MKFASMSRQKNHEIKNSYKPTHKGKLPLWIQSK
jgi:hypothetical protein